MTTSRSARSSEEAYLRYHAQRCTTSSTKCRSAIIISGQAKGGGRTERAPKKSCAEGGYTANLLRRNSAQQNYLELTTLLNVATVMCVSKAELYSEDGVGARGGSRREGSAGL